jgi:endonuclease YncB( thermonuclease family)
MAAVVEPVRDVIRLAVRDARPPPLTAPRRPGFFGGVSVIDGDTVRFDGATYRLVGFNTPETGRQAQCDGENALGRAATLRLREIVAAGSLDLERVSCACRSGTEGTQACNYGRLCGILKSGGRDVGGILIAEGLAHEYTCRGSSCPRRRSWCG